MTNGFHHYKAWFSQADQEALLAEIANVLSKAPLYTPTMPNSGKPFSVQESNCGPLGWVSDKKGYRYQEHHPVTNNQWPSIPARLIALWQQVSQDEYLPEACLINYYKEKARMGLHQDKDEQDFTAPIVSVSLGCSAIFRIGTENRRDKTRSITLHSGDVIVMGGKSRMFYHGIDRIIKESSELCNLIPGLKGGRINLTLRRVNKLPS